LDLSGIVPSNAVAVSLYVRAQDDATASFIFFRKNGNSNAYATPGLRTQAANVRNDNNVVVACDSNQVIEYFAANVTWIDLDITVLGWWLA
jgi:hypothetical protein